MNFWKYILILIILIFTVSFISCSSTEKLIIYSPQKVKIVKIAGGYDVSYYIPFSKNLDKYSVTYYLKEENDWKKIGTVRNDIPKKHKRKADYAVSMLEYFATDSPCVIKARIVAVKDKGKGFGHTVTNEYIFNIK